MQNEALARELDKVYKSENFAQFLAEHDVDGTAEEFKAFADKKKIDGRVLSENELEKAVGGAEYGYVDGGVDWSDIGIVREKSNASYLFNLGDAVIVDCLFRNLTGIVENRRIRSVKVSGSVCYRHTIFRR
ncbi:MAG: hypothetical protein ACI4KR_10510 [Ruminiclostridium sp.]